MSLYPKRVLMVTFQAGCANSIVLIAKALQEHGAEVFGMCAGASAGVVARAGLGCREFDVDVTRDVVDAAIEEFAPDLVITGSNASNRFEFNFRLSARERGIHVVTTLDYWSAYDGRFRDPETAVTSLPDKLLVTDTVMRDELRKAGFEDVQIDIVGNPYFEHLARESGDPGVGRSRTARRILFTSQPIGALFGSSEDEPRFLGYEEGQVFELLADYLRSNSACKLYVKPHPREDAGGWQARLNAARDVRSQIVFIGGRGNSLGLLKAADVVVGMSSNMLLEALVVGTPAVSIQPNANGKFEFYGSFSGLVPTAFSADDVPALLDQALNQNSSNAPEKAKVLYEGALGRCLKAITA